jgi:hypothetical protein
MARSMVSSGMTCAAPSAHASLTQRSTPEQPIQRCRPAVASSRDALSNQGDQYNERGDPGEQAGAHQVEAVLLHDVQAGGSGGSPPWPVTRIARTLLGGDACWGFCTSLLHGHGPGSAGCAELQQLRREDSSDYGSIDCDQSAAAGLSTLDS